MQPVTTDDLLRGSGKYLVGWLLSSPAVAFFFLSPEIVPDYLRVAAFTAAGVVTWMTVEIAWVYTFAFWPKLNDDMRTRHYSPWLVWAMGLSYVSLLVPACYLVYLNFTESVVPQALPFLTFSLIAAVIWESALLRQFRHLTTRG